jgi:hypothetical protein
MLNTEWNNDTFQYDICEHCGGKPKIWYADNDAAAAGHPWHICEKCAHEYKLAGSTDIYEDACAP